VTAGALNDSFLWYDVVNAAPQDRDAEAFTTGGSIPVGQHIYNDGPVITPPSNGLTFAAVKFGNGPSNGFASGSPTDACFDYVSYTGQTDTSRMDNSDGRSHYFNYDLGTQHYNWFVTHTLGTTAAASAIHFKGLFDLPGRVSFWRSKPPAGARGPFARAVSRFRKPPQTYFVPGTGTTFFQSIAGTMTSSGGLVIQTQKVISGSLTSAGAIQKQTGKVVSGALTPSGALQKQTGKVLSGALASAGAIVKQAGKVLSGALTSAGGLVKQTNKVLAGTLTSSGTLTAFKVALISLSGTLNMSGALAKQVGKNLSGTLSPVGALSKRIAISLAGSLTSAGALIAAKVGATARKIYIFIFDD
jgi:hypothetical protein